MKSEFKPMPGYVVVELDEEEEDTDGFLLPEAQANKFATVLKVGPHLNPWKRIFRYPKDLKPGDRVLLATLRGQVHANILAVRLDEIRLKE